MIATGVTLEQLVKAERDNNVRLENVRRLNPKGTRWSFVLRPTINKPFYIRKNGRKVYIHEWQRKSTGWRQDDRIVYAICWHGHKAFLETLFEQAPNAIVRSHLGREKVVHRGSVDESTRYIPLGPPITGGYPLAEDACFCGEADER